MSLKDKMNGLLEAYPGYGKNRESDSPAQGSSQKPEVQVLEKGSGGGKTVRKSNAGIAPLGAKVGAFEEKPSKQGSSKDAAVEDLGKDEPGNAAFAKGKPKAGLTARGAGAAPNFKTVADPTSVVKQSGSKGNVHQEETEVEAEGTEELDTEVVDGVEVDADADAEASETLAEAEKAEAEKAEFMAEKKAELARDVTNLFSGEVDLSEDFKAKAASLFEAAVVARVAFEVALVEDAVASKAVEIIAENEAAMVEKVDAYLTHVAEEWVAQNELAVKNTLRTEIAENFMESLRQCFVENFIDIPEEKYDVLGEMQNALDTLRAENEEVMTVANELAEEIEALKRTRVIAQVSEGMTKTQIEKLATLVEEISFEDEASFGEKLEIVKKNLFSGTGSTAIQNVIEEVDGSDSVVSEAVDPEIEALNAKISGKMRF